VLIRRVTHAVDDRPLFSERGVLLQVVGVGVQIGHALGNHHALRVVPGSIADAILGIDARLAIRSLRAEVRVPRLAAATRRCGERLADLVRARESAKRDYQAREGISLSYVPFVIKAAVDALKQYPTFNAHWSDAGILAKRRINMGVAVAVDDGLLVPVVRDVDQLSINGLNHAIADVAARARAAKLRLDDYGGSTFTIDNTGWFGSNLTMPIINVPEVAILTMEAITKRPVVRETPEGDVIAIRPVMNMVLVEGV